MKNIEMVSRLVKLVDKYGYAKTAVMIMERDTQSLKRWINLKEIPEYKFQAIKTYLRGVK